MTGKWQVEYLIVFLFCSAVLLGPSYALFDSYDYDFTASPDLETYLGLANLEFDQSFTRKYRVIIPFLAGGVNYVFGPLFTAIAPSTFPGPDFSLCFSFFMVNLAVMSLFGVLIYALCRAFGASRLGACTGLLAVLTCRWTFYITALPLVDSLYMVAVTMALLGIRLKNTPIIVLSIFVGPWAKESFIFIAPLIFFFSHISKWKQILFFLMSGVLVFGFRYYLDHFDPVAFETGIRTDIDHLENVGLSLSRLLSFHGLYEIVSLFGIWGLLFFFLKERSVRGMIASKIPVYLVIYIFIVLVHALLSTDLARMFYLAMPVLAVVFALIMDQIPFVKKYLIAVPPTGK